jgi:beta-N-acetylhexosaminidase
LLCFGRDQDHLTYQQVKDALVDAVGAGRLAASRLEESAARVARLRRWAAAARGLAAGSAGAGQPDVGLAAARRALRLDGVPRPIVDPVLVELVPPSNIAVGQVPWGLARWVAPGSVHRISTYGGSAEEAADLAVSAVVAAATDRPLLIVVRDAHRYPAAQSVVTALLAARPDSIVIEMGLPIWRPPARTYLATFGATRASSLATAEMLGLTRAGHMR